MSAIKYHFLPDSDTVKAIFVLIAILTVRQWLSNSPSTSPQVSSPDTAAPIFERTDKYVASTLDENAAQPKPFPLPESSKWNRWNLRPTDPKILYGRPTQEDAAAEALLRYQMGPEKATEPSPNSDTEPTTKPDEAKSITFADGIAEVEDTIPTETSDVDIVKTWVHKNVGRTLSWFDSQVLICKVSSNLSNILEKASTEGKNLLVGLGAELVDDNAYIFAIRDYDCFLLSIPRDIQQRFKCEDESITHSTRSNRTPPGKQIATVSNLHCQVVSEENVKKLKLTAHCKSDAWLETGELCFLVEIWNGDYAFSRYTEIVKKQPELFDWSSDIQFEASEILGGQLDDGRPMILFLSVVRKTSQNAISNPEPSNEHSKYESVSNVVCVGYDSGELIPSTRL